MSPKASWDWLSSLPSTNAGFLISVVLAMATAVKVLGWGWEPPVEWLGFIIAWSGLGTAQFLGKRMTEFKPGDLPAKMETTVTKTVSIDPAPKPPEPVP